MPPTIEKSPEKFTCRQNCGACCIAPSISSIIPDMPNGKPAGIACVHLNADFQCQLFEQSSRPLICGRLKPCHEMCGDNRDEALHYLTQLEQLTSA